VKTSRARLEMDTISKSVPNSVICSWFELLFYINASLFLIIFFVFLLWIVAPPKGGVLPPWFYQFRLLSTLIGLVITGTNSLFFYLICDRALKPVKSD
jgi:hypothetical protein